MNFVEAKKLAREGELVRRKAWDEEVFIFMRPYDELPLEVVVNAKSLPQKFRDLFKPSDSLEPSDKVHIPFSEHLCMFTGDEVLNSVEISTRDARAEDWEVTDGK